MVFFFLHFQDRTSSKMGFNSALVAFTFLLGYHLAQGTVSRSSGPDYNGGSVEATDLPTFITKGRSFRVVTKDTVVLPCDVDNPGNFVLAWKKGIAILTAGSIKVTPDARFRLVDGYNLEIHDVQTNDAGNYVCQIATLQPREITHTVEILVPPRISYVSSNGKLEVKKGTTVSLQCKASGNPVPNITWTRKNNLLPSGEKSDEGSSITIEQATRHHAGTYICSASNGVGEPVNESINVHVKYPPEIEVERSWVHSGEGYEAQLVCIVYADPTADVHWYRDTLRLDATDRRLVHHKGSRNTLIIGKVQASDFGNYSCVADNGLGKAKQFLELSGKPNPALFRSHHQSRFKDSYNITWSVNSYTPIEEFKLFFRKVPSNSPPLVPGQLMGQPNINQGSKRPTRRQENDTYGQILVNGRFTGDWNDVILPAMASEQFTQQMSYLIKGLEPGVNYEARVQAKNRFGWNELSDSFQFSTKGAEGSALESSPEPAIYSDPEVRDMGVTALGSSSPRTGVTQVAIVAVLATLTWT
uniref:Ig-like domain-containing protein n=2 Tax=Clastoptera arizonana TaxID=38151 RepID=A0A1B6CBY1_9HEMI